MNQSRYTVSMEADREAIRQLILDAQAREGGITVRALAKLIGMSHGNLVKIRNKKTVPNPASCRKMAPILGVKPKYLQRIAGHSEEADDAPLPARPLSSLASDVARGIKGLEKQIAQMQARLAALESAPAPTPIRPRPHLGVAGAARPSRGTDTSHLEDGHIIEFSIDVEGDCLTPQIHPGDTLIMRREKQPKSGDIAWLRVNGEMQLKRVVSRNGAWVLETNEGQVVIPAEVIECEGVMLRRTLPE